MSIPPGHPHPRSGVFGGFDGGSNQFLRRLDVLLQIKEGIVRRLRVVFTLNWACKGGIRKAKFEL